MKAPLVYYGSKTTAAASRGVGRWVVSQLPVTPHYLEAYSGMAGVLFGRPAVRQECVNDLDGRITAWWRELRDHPERLLHRLRHTPWSRPEYDAARRVLDAPAEHSQQDVALAVAVELMQGRIPTLSSSPGWRVPPHKVDKNGREPRNIDSWLARPALLGQAYQRMRAVMLECRPAHELLPRWLRDPLATIYLDPPYAEGGEYYSVSEGHEQVLGLLAGGPVEANVAISGYPSCVWQELEEHGWHRYEYQTISLATPSSPSNDVTRTEVLWTNYDAQGQLSLL